MPKRVASPSPSRRRTFIREWRKANNDMTQEQLAELTGMSAANLSRIEKGEQDYTQSVLEAVSKALNVDIISLLTRRPKEGEHIWPIWQAATPDQRQQISEIARTITRPPSRQQ